MKTLLLEFKTSLLLTFVFALLLCGVYPLVVWAVGQALFHDQANGSLVVDANGAVRGSALLAQNFSSEKYFHPRPSAAGTGYDATSSSGSNLGPTSQKLADSIKAAVTAYRAANGLAADALVPADAVTSSGSGLDPHISLANANIQAARVATARHLPLEQVRNLIAPNTDGPDLGILGEPGVNVLKLNRALDAAR
jgi:K+-transporting ATPase ATPase C chain